MTKKRNTIADCNSYECKFGKGNAAKNRLFNVYKRAAKKKKLEFSLDYDDFVRLTSSDCHYCSSPPRAVCRAPRKTGDYVYNGLDRKDNTKGYSIDNVVPCCKYCNSAKADRTISEFKGWAKQLSSHLDGQPVASEPDWDDSKCWGRVWHRFCDALLNESLLEVEAGWCCSIHWHASRWNCFVVIDATIAVETFGTADNPPGECETYEIISKGQSLIIPPRVWHRFSVLDRGRVAEMYWTTDGSACDIGDIIRWNIGGPLEQS